MDEHDAAGAQQEQQPHNAHNGRFSLVAVLEQHPEEAPRGGADLHGGTDLRVTCAMRTERVRCSHLSAAHSGSHPLMHLRHEKGEAGRAVGRERGAGVETEPAEPQERPADDDVNDVVRPQALHAEALARAEYKGNGQTGEARRDVDHVAPGEVEVSRRAEKTPGPPLSVTDGTVDGKVPKEDEEEDGLEFHTLGEGATDEGRGDGGEGELEAHEDRLRHCRGGGIDRRWSHAVGRILVCRVPCPYQPEPIGCTDQWASGKKA